MPGPHSVGAEDNIKADVRLKGIEIILEIFLAADVASFLSCRPLTGDE